MFNFYTYKDTHILEKEKRLFVAAGTTKRVLYRNFDRLTRRVARKRRNFRFIFRRLRLWRRKRWFIRRFKEFRTFFLLNKFIPSLRKKKRIFFLPKPKFFLFKRRKRLSFRKRRKTRALSRPGSRLLMRVKRKLRFRDVSCNLDIYSSYSYRFNYLFYKKSSLVSNQLGIWKFSKYLNMGCLLPFNLLFSVRFTRIYRDFVHLYFTLNSMYRFSRNSIFRNNRFALVYGVTHLIFFKSFFYLNLALDIFFRRTIYKKHRLLLIVLRKLLSIKLFSFYKNYGFYGCEILFFGKLGGFGGSKKKRYKISFGFKSSMDSNYRVHQYLYEYFTLHGRIGSRCKVTLLN